MGCYVNDLGVVCSAGIGLDEFYANLFNFDAVSFFETDPLSSGRRKKVGRVGSQLPTFPAELSAHFSRTNHLLYAALIQMQPTVARLLAQYPSKRIGVVFGTCTSGSTEIDRSRAIERDHGEIPEHYRYDVELMDDVANFVKKYLGVSGPAVVVSTACTSSGKAIAMAKRYLESGILDAVIVGGADSYSLATLNGFDSLASLSESRCQPFGKNRDGINLGEAAAVFVFSREKTNIRILGVGESSDAHHMSAPDPNGVGAEMAVRQALEMAKLAPNDIGYINLHGTATVANDEMESALINRVFGEGTPCSSTKIITGHTLGAASAVELAACIAVLARHDGDFPVIPQHGSYERDPRLPRINLAEVGGRTDKPAFLSTSYAFGGSNTCVIVGREPGYVA